jgi:hypothetical protein
MSNDLIAMQEGSDVLAKTFTPRKHEQPASRCAFNSRLRNPSAQGIIAALI